MNKKIASEFAIGVVVLIALVFGIIFWFGGQKAQTPTIPANTLPDVVSVPVQEKTISPTECVKNNGASDYFSKNDLTYWDETGKEITFSDVCLDSNRLQEYLCSNSKEYSTTQFDCPRGCSNGKCNRYIKVIYPNGGEIFRIGSVRTIKWKAEGVSRVHIFIHDTSLKNQTGFNYIIQDNGTLDAGTGEYNWIIDKRVLPTSKKNNAYKVQVISDEDPEVNDYSDNNFSIKNYNVCKDSDGDDQYKSGCVQYADNENQGSSCDTCSGNYLNEQICRNDKLEEKQYYCELGCEYEGKCKKP
ncbi:MAG: hypothetical protein NTZ97_03460 [Candidatus Moranbacteria bacterium]|nr:hypothetical protein [Candidatus Moranbacteria bacterium]